MRHMQNQWRAFYLSILHFIVNWQWPQRLSYRESDLWPLDLIVNNSIQWAHVDFHPLGSRHLRHLPLKRTVQIHPSHFPTTQNTLMWCMTPIRHRSALASATNESWFLSKHDLLAACHLLSPSTISTHTPGWQSLRQPPKIPLLDSGLNLMTDF